MLLPTKINVKNHFYTIQLILKHCLLSAICFVCVTTYADQYNYATLAQIAYYPIYKLNANVLALKQSQISPQITGHIQQIHVEIGNRVKKNQVLAQLDCFNHERQLQLASIGLNKIQQTIALLKKQQNREKKLQQTQHLSQAQLEVTDNKLATAKLSSNEQQIKIKQLEYTVGLCEVKAPFSGIITQKLTEVGQAAGPSTIIFEVLNSQDKVLQVMVPQHLIDNLMKGTAYRFKIEQQNYPVTHKMSIPKIQPNRSQEIHFNIPNHPSIIVGMSGQLLWQDQQAHIPAKYLKRYNNHLGIYLLSNNQLVFKKMPAAQEGRAVATLLPLNAKLVIFNPSLNDVGVKVID